MSSVLAFVGRRVFLIGETDEDGDSCSESEYDPLESESDSAEGGFGCLEAGIGGVIDGADFLMVVDEVLTDFGCGIVMIEAVSLDGVYRLSFLSAVAIHRVISE